MDISIHAPIVGCDIGMVALIIALAISIHAPIVGCDGLSACGLFSGIKFQSTHPSWGATQEECLTQLQNINFNPRTHRGVRLPFGIYHYSYALFQSTHPSWGATSKNYDVKNDIDGFQSTHPSWGATNSHLMKHMRERISIHAPIVGCD